MAYHEQPRLLTTPVGTPFFLLKHGPATLEKRVGRHVHLGHPAVLGLGNFLIRLLVLGLELFPLFDLLLARLFTQVGVALPSRHGLELLLLILPGNPLHLDLRFLRLLLDALGASNRLFFGRIVLVAFP